MSHNSGKTEEKKTKKQEKDRKSTTGNTESGSEMTRAEPQPRVRSAPQAIVKQSKPRHNKLSMEEEHRMYLDPWPIVQKIEARLHWLLERQERRLDSDRDDGYISADYEDWADGNHGRMFFMDEDLDRNLWAAEGDEKKVQELSIEDIQIPEHMMQEVDLVEGPNQREVAYTVAEYEEKTSQKRSRHSGNMKVEPSELNTLYSRVSDYIKETVGPIREVAAVVPVAVAEVVTPPAPEVIPMEEETPGMRFMRNRLIEQRRRNLLKRLADDLPPLVGDHEVPQPRGYDSRPDSPLNFGPEPSTMFSFDEDELNQPSL